MTDLAGSVLNRRHFIAAGAATALLPGAAHAARGGGLIDVHHHIRPPGAPEGFARLTASWSPAGAIADMDRCGIAAGMAYPGPVLVPGADARRDLARRFNDFGAGVGAAHPGRFGLFASLPFPDVEASLAEIDHALDALNADGFGIATSYGDMWLGDARLWPIYERLNARRAVVFVHPHDAACCGPTAMTYIQPGMDGSWIDWPMNTARTIFSLMASGTLRKFPDIRFIFAHGGGVMPLLINRLAGFSEWNAVGPDKLKTLFPDGIEAEFRTLHFECAQAWSPVNFAALAALVPGSNLLFGSDYPFFSLDTATKGFKDLHLPLRAVHAIGRTNAAALLPRWA